MLRKAYDKTLSLAGHPQVSHWLFWVSVIESSIFPVPPDALLIPMCLKNRERAFFYAGLCTAGSVLGGLIGYAIGMFFWAGIGDPLITFYGLQDQFREFQTGFAEHGFLLVFFFGLTFFPYKVITIASGFFSLNLGLFILASVASRAIRFFLEAGLLWKFGDPIRRFVEKRLALTATLALIVVLAIILGIDLFWR